MHSRIRAVVVRLGIAGVVMVGWAVWSWAAEDPKQTILLLPDEAAECRYVESLANQAESLFSSTKNLQVEGAALETNRREKDAAIKYLAASQSAQKVVLDSALNVTAAIGQMKIKHGQLPACAVPYDTPAQHRVRDVINFAKDMADRSLLLLR